MIFFFIPSLIFLMLMTTLMMSLNLIMNKFMIILEWKITNIFCSPLFFSLVLDSYGMIFITTILFISFNVLIFSKHYMSNELFTTRFTKLICLFITSMNLLILLPHMIILLLGWDGLGLSSFLLIIFYQNSSSLSAGMLTALINRLGDIMIIFSISLMLSMGHWNIFHMWTKELMTMMFILTASMTKSAQIPFSSWLPAAMEAPTPVSALVHSSTLVTAGVFLLFRFNPFLSQFLLFNKTLMIFSSLTMVMASINASMHFDMKKIVALSTLSQLGLMMLSLSILSPLFTFFHLITHAMFKALLFLCVGTIIFYVEHNQDMRMINNLNKIMPLTSSSLLIANLALCGIPFLAGYFSKDLILEESFISSSNIYIIFIIMLSTGLTVNYSFRMMKYLIWSTQLFFPYKNFSNKNLNFIKPIIFMSIFAIISGSLLNWLIINYSNNYIPLIMKMIIPLIILVGMLIPSILNMKNMKTLKFFYSSMWLLTPLITQNMINTFIFKSNKMFMFNDSGWLEMVINNYLFLNIFSMMVLYIQKNIINKMMLLIMIMFIPFFFM
uniref:NADH-ubiquinone oxidoreductase chain 5 n=1 Tax=Siboglinum ekmani TaxID=167800 RepID=A0A0E3DQV2_9ANNE|nr:NADH dehydrogenase subunit 5 [Siboglinum ekmani]